jgi:hypothetical protein
MEGSKSKVVPAHATKVYVRVEVHKLLTLALYDGDCSASSLDRLTLGPNTWKGGKNLLLTPVNKHLHSCSAWSLGTIPTLQALLATK